MCVYVCVCVFGHLFSLFISTDFCMLFDKNFCSCLGFVKVQGKKNKTKINKMTKNHLGVFDGWQGIVDVKSSIEGPKYILNK